MGKRKPRVVASECAQCGKYYATRKGYEFEGLSSEQLASKAAELEEKGFKLVVQGSWTLARDMGRIYKYCPTCKGERKRLESGPPPMRRPRKFIEDPDAGSWGDTIRTYEDN